MFYVYMLECADASYYLGHTDDLELRIFQHNSGKIDGYTSARLPIKLVWHQTFNSREEAIQAEVKLKRWSRRKKEALISNDWEAISLFSKNRSK